MGWIGCRPVQIRQAFALSEAILFRSIRVIGLIRFLAHCLLFQESDITREDISAADMQHFFDEALTMRLHIIT